MKKTTTISVPLLVAGLLILAPGPAHPATLVHYFFEDVALTPTAAPFTVDPLLTATDFTAGGGAADLGPGQAGDVEPGNGEGTLARQ
ncbi:MAG: hypothetical protein AAF492_06645, partial [Verrucomicrobiota bacterium]